MTSVLHSSAQSTSAICEILIRQIRDKQCSVDELAIALGAEPDFTSDYHAVVQDCMGQAVADGKATRERDSYSLTDEVAFLYCGQLPRMPGVSNGVFRRFGPSHRGT